MGFKEETLAERNEKAAKARQAQLEKFRARATANESTRVERGAERAAVHAARETRMAGRKADKQAAAERVVQERAAAEVAKLEAEKQAFIAHEKETADNAARKIKAHADQKLARDERYAARKKRRK